MKTDNEYGDILSEMLPNSGSAQERRGMAQLLMDDSGALESLPLQVQIFCHLLSGKKGDFDAIRALSGKPDLGMGKARAYLHKLLQAETDPGVLATIVDALYDVGTEDSLTPLFEYARNGAPAVVADASIGALVGILSRASGTDRFEARLSSAISNASSPASRKKLELLRPAVAQKNRGLKQEEFMNWVSKKKPELGRLATGRDNRMRARVAPLK